MSDFHNTHFSLAGKTAVITGACGFLGKHICEGFASAGAAVVAVDLNEKACHQFAATLQKKFEQKILGIACDVTDKEFVTAMVAEVLDKMPSLDILINNAAYRSDDPVALHAPFETYSLKEWKRLMTVNLDGVFLCSQAVGGAMARGGKGGVIIQMASIYGVKGTDHSIYKRVNQETGRRLNNPAAYSTSKGGVIALTKYLASYWAKDGIRVNAVSPGGIYNNQPPSFVEDYSSQVPLARMAKPGEIVGPLIYLSSDAANYITGQNLIVDGGLCVGKG